MVRAEAGARSDLDELIRQEQPAADRPILHHALIAVTQESRPSGMQRSFQPHIHAVRTPGRHTVGKYQCRAEEHIRVANIFELTPPRRGIEPEVVADLALRSD